MFFALSMPHPEQKKDQIQGPAAGGKSPAIRTMKTDVDELFKTSRPSLGAMISTSQENIAMADEGRPSKLPVILTVVLLGIAILGGGAFFVNKFLSPSALSGQKTSATPAVQKIPAPAPLFATETSRTITVKMTDRAGFVRLMADSMQEKEREGTMKRMVIKVQDGPQERFATLADFFDLWRILPPASLASQFNGPAMFFISYEKNGARLGFAARTSAPDRTLGDMLSWESGLFSAFAPLFFDEKPAATLAPFEDRTYRNIDWRFMKLSQSQDLGIGYTIFPVGNVLVFTTSKSAMETVINRLFDAR